MTEIEWLDADGRPIPAAPPDAVGPRAAGRASRFDVRSVGQWADIGWLLAAALAVIAPFLRLYELTIEQGIAQQVDGWGRFDAAVNGVSSAGAHGIRFGIVSIVAAALVLAGVALGRTRRAGRWATALAAVAHAVAEGLLAATAALVLLDIDALYDSVRSEVALTAVGPHRPSLHIGAGAWTMLAAAVVGALATILEVVARQGAGPERQALTAEDRPVLGPGYEDL